MCLPPVESPLTPAHTAVVPSLNQPVRAYPLRPINEPAVYILGERQGQKVFPGGAPGSGAPGMPERAPSMQGLPPFGNPQAMLAQQNSQMEALERRTQRERDRSASVSAVRCMPVVYWLYSDMHRISDNHILSRPSTSSHASRKTRSMVGHTLLSHISQAEHLAQRRSNPSPQRR